MIETKKNDQAWLMTVMDLVLLMICFFVMLYSLNKIDKSDAKSISEHINFGGRFVNIKNTSSSISQIYNILKKNNIDKNIKVEMVEYIGKRIVRIYIPENYLKFEMINSIDWILSPLLFNIAGSKININLSYDKFLNFYKNDNNFASTENLVYILEYAYKLREIFEENFPKDTVSFIVSTNENDDNSNTIIYIDILDNL